MEQNARDLELREQDRWLPIANVARLMKNTLPPTAKVSKDAKECMQECVSEFISFITSEASDKCLREKRKTINGEDILYSMYDLGFENYAEVLKIYLAKYREQQVLRQERGETRLTKKQAKLQAAQQQAAQEAAAASEESGETREIEEIVESSY
ncbi:Hap31 transcription factor that regulates CYC1 [Candida orthopsilosis Co 90-125]|uniref:Hap31 transcription factor that regulates CYC1 n=1 Tax=Candida orthopsilosis (strain 90-125) TaxID=1136231 RepID=H8X4W5_CANO9|nr:Hap31 transcription factor that regulates CYC1 [Candida orthopsilosis Co 90-125]CCG23057.1 Hap31 transcription factor that regulates CYC1 [Candida orthopsilosis Co 90-125]